MEVDLESLMKEGTQFHQLRKAYQRTGNPPAGSPAFIINKTWVDKYKKYIFYSEISKNLTPNMEIDHCKEHHPGPINNNELLELDGKFLKGTGTIKGFEKEVVDTYLQRDVRENFEFEFCSQEIWDFLHSRYPADTAIKRYYIKG